MLVCDEASVHQPAAQLRELSRVLISASCVRSCGSLKGAWVLVDFEDQNGQSSDKVRTLLTSEGILIGPRAFQRAVRGWV